MTGTFAWGVWVNQKEAVRLKLSLPQAFVFAYMYDNYGKEWVTMLEDGWCWLAKDKIAEELPILDSEGDTIYRHWKVLEKAGLLKLKTISNKSCYKLTMKAKSWGFSGSERVGSESEVGSESDPKEVGPESELGSDQNPRSDQNPTKVGSESEPGSDQNPSQGRKRIRPISNTSINNTNEPDTRINSETKKAVPRPEHDWQKPQVEFETDSMRKFLASYPKNPKQKTEFRRQWWDQGCEDIADAIFNALELQLSTCAEFEQPRFMVPAETYIGDRKWENKIVSRENAPVADKAAPIEKQVCIQCNKPKDSFVDDGRCMDCFGK